MKKKNDLIFIIVFIVIVSLSFLYLSQASYAKYRKQITGNVSSTVASWNIKVNDETINNKTVLSNYITPTFDSNSYIKSGVLAPGTVGSFIIRINAEEVDVDFDYEISGTVSEDTPLDDLIITDYEINSNNTIIPYSNKITGTILKNTQNTTVTIYFKWNDDSTETMDNQEDTEYATTSTYQNTKIELNIKFTQKN